MKTLYDIRFEKVPNDEKYLQVIKSDYLCTFNNEHYKFLVIPKTKKTYKFIIANTTTGVIEQISDTYYFKNRWFDFLDRIDGELCSWAFKCHFDPNNVSQSFEIISK